MFRAGSILLAITLVLLGFQNCSPLKSSDLSEQQAGLAAAPNYNDLNKKVFQSQCLACHGSGSSPDFSSYSALMAGTTVLASDPNGSPLYVRVANHTMPPGAPLNESFIQAIYAWIEAGAPENATPRPTPGPGPGPQPTIPTAPSALSSMAISTSRINLSWTDNSSNESGFTVERSTNGVNFANVASLVAGVTSYSDTSLTPATTYYYRVQAFNATGTSSFSNTANATTQTPAQPPAAPSGLSLSAASSSQINLTWMDNASNEDGFQIERSTNGSTFSQVATVGANVSTFSNTGLSASTTYHYRVRAFNSAGNSSYTAVVNAATQAPPVTVPTAPSSLSAVAASTTQINLSWMDNSGNETEFRIERSPNGTTFTQIAVVGANVTSYMNGGLSAGTTYHYRVRAANSAGTSSYSNSVSRATQNAPQPPSAPTQLSASATSTSQINLSWTDNSSDEMGFYIERSNDGATFTQVGSVGANAAAYSNTGLTASTTYHYRVRAYNANGSSAYTAVVSAMTQGTTAPGGYNPWVPRNSARILFTGHSLLDNPLPDHVADIASRRGDDLRWNQQNVGGSPIRIRTKGANTSASGWPGYSTGKNRQGENMNIINELLNPQTIGSGNRYDALVITERHDILSVLEWEGTIEYARDYQNRFIAGNSSGRSYFYHSWYDINKNNPANFIAHEKNAQVTWECAVSKINDNLRNDGRSDRMILLPAGGALVDLVERIVADQVPGITGSTSAKLNQIFSDNVHMTNLGSYYMSLVVYSSVFGKSPQGLAAPSGMNAQTVSAMQQIAWNFVSNYYSQASPGRRTMAECRTFTAQNTCATWVQAANRPGDLANCRNFWGSSTQSIFR